MAEDDQDDLLGDDSEPDFSVADSEADVVDNLP